MLLLQIIGIIGIEPLAAILGGCACGAGQEWRIHGSIGVHTPAGSLIRRPCGDEKDLLAKIRDGNSIKKGLAKTFTKVIYATYGLIHGLLWDGMDYIYDNPDMIDVIQGIAYINIKKTPGVAVANASELSRYYERDKAIIDQQIKIFNPDVIICGGTESYLRNDLGLKKENEFYSGECCYWIQDGKRIIISVEHPNSRSRNDYYVDSVVKATQHFQQFACHS